MLLLKGCPRCRGDLQSKSDQHGEYRTCLQCGFVLYLPRPVPKSFQVKAGREKPGRKKSAA